MSHFTSVQTRIAERKYLLAALADLDLEVDETSEFVRGYQGAREATDLKLRDHEVGFRKRGATFEVFADWYVVRGLDQRKFERELTQRYAYHAARGELEAQGFSLADEQTAEDGSVRLVLRRMG